MPVQRVDQYDERMMYGALFPLVSAFPTPETVAAVMPRKRRLNDPVVARRDLGEPPEGHSVRRTTSDPWTRDNVVVVSIPDELLAAHTEEVGEVVAGRARSTAIASQPVPPFDEHRDAQLCLMRRRIEVDPVAWATRVARADEHGMIVVAEHARDWAPWSPMLRLALQLRELDESSAVLRAAEHRLRLIARRLLDAQGLGDVRVDDTLNLPPVMQRAVTKLLHRETPRA